MRITSRSDTTLAAARVPGFAYPLVSVVHSRTRMAETASGPRDLEDVPAEVMEKVKFLLVDSADEVLAAGLRSNGPTAAADSSIRR